MDRNFPPSSATAQVVFGAHSRCGSGRTSNDDHYAIVELGRHQTTVMTSMPDGVIPARFEESGYAMVVADGIGPGGNAELASRTAIGVLMHLMLHFGKWNLRVDTAIAHEIMDRTKRFYRQVDRIVADEGRIARTPLYSTLTAVFGAGRDLFFAHVGHSRAYLWREGELMRLTRDQTVGARRPTRLAPLVDVNGEARDLRHILTDTIGMSGPIGPTIDIERFQLSDNDRVLVCTNGLTDVVEEETIGSVLASDRAPGEQCRLLTESAAASAGGDDATALVAHYRLPT
jgi:PPM family protein phosphatase